jgi:hypothetical protein
MDNFEIIQPERTKFSRLVLGNARILMMVFILFTVIVVMTTDIKLASITSFSDLGLEFFVLFFCSYGMYLCCADGGIKSGYSTEAYKNAVKRFLELKKRIEETMLPRMRDFCNHYIDEELKKERMQYLSVVCITYDEYIEKYVKLGREEIDALSDLTSSQKKAVKKANDVSRIKLTPEKIMTQGKAVHTRSALTISPEAMMNIVKGIKVFKMCFTLFFTALIVLDVILEPSWTVFAGVCLKLATVVINGFDGHKDGFNNIAVHTVNFMNNQSALMQQALLYNEANPITQTTT